MVNQSNLPHLQNEHYARLTLDFYANLPEDTPIDQLNLARRRAYGPLRRHMERLGLGSGRSTHKDTLKSYLDIHRRMTIDEDPLLPPPPPPPMPAPQQIAHIYGPIAQLNQFANTAITDTTFTATATADETRPPPAKKARKVISYSDSDSSVSDSDADITPRRPAPLKDCWVWTNLDEPFPEAPVQSPLGDIQRIVSLWYKHGKPIHGVSWNDAGVVKSSFAFGTAELTDKRTLRGEIQILQQKGDHRSNGFWYNWIRYKQRFEKDVKEREILRCGSSQPIYWSDRPEGPLLGYLDDKEVAHFSLVGTGKALQVTGEVLDNMLIIVRELKGGPPGCQCSDCPKKALPPVEKLIWNQWKDYRLDDPFPTAANVTPIKALNRDLKSIEGLAAAQYVAVWYKQGEPVMGRVTNANGKIAACFSWGGHSYTENVGSLQILAALPEGVAGFTYDWIDYPEAVKHDAQKEWRPVHVDNRHYDISPAVLMVEGKEILGKVDIRNERATAGWGQAVIELNGDDLRAVRVLCRKAVAGVTLDS